MGVHPIGNGNGPFYDDPSDIAQRINDNALRYIEYGEAYISEVTLPYFEAEAIARIKARTMLRPVVEPDKRKEPEHWRAKWVCEAEYAERHMSGYDAVARAAISVLLTASRLRHALEDKTDPERIAALSMLLVCSVFEGGYMLEYEAIKTANEVIEKASTARYKKSIGKEADDHKLARDSCVYLAAQMWKEDETRLIGSVVNDLHQRLLDNHDKFKTLDLTPAPETIKGWLKAAGADGKLSIPEGAQKPGRPPKK